MGCMIFVLWTSLFVSFTVLKTHLFISRLKENFKFYKLHEFQNDWDELGSSKTCKFPTVVDLRINKIQCARQPKQAKYYNNIKCCHTNCRQP